MISVDGIDRCNCYYTNFGRGGHSGRYRSRTIFCIRQMSYRAAVVLYVIGRSRRASPLIDVSVVFPIHYELKQAPPPKEILILRISGLVNASKSFLKWGHYQNLARKGCLASPLHEYSTLPFSQGHYFLLLQCRGH